MSYFVFDGEDINFYETETEAVNKAQEAIDGWRDCCDPGWPEEVASVCWGRVYSSAVPLESGDENQYCEYELEDYHREWRCNICGGIVRFDGTKPSIKSMR